MDRGSLGGAICIDDYAAGVRPPKCAALVKGDLAEPIDSLTLPTRVKTIRCGAS